MYILGGKVQPTDAVVAATGNVDRDLTHLEAARDYLDARGGGTLWIKGEVNVSQFVSFAEPCWLRGLGANAALVFSGNGRFGWGNDWDAIANGTSYDLTPTSAFTEYIESPNLALNPGDYVIVYSDDLLSDATPHSSGWLQRPMELHQIKEMRNGTQYFFDDFLVDALTVNPKIVKLPAIKGGGVADLTMKYTGVAENTCSFDIRNTVGFHMENLTWDFNGPGCIRLANNYDFTAHRVNCLGKHNFNTSWGYHMLLRGGNGFLWTDSIVHGVRHAFTTGNTSTTAQIRWGTSRNWVIRGVQASNNGRVLPSVSSLIMFDAHSEGWGGLFESCLATIPGEAVNTGFSTRARATTIKNCVVEGGKNAPYGFRMYANDCKIISPTARGCWFGVDINSINGFSPNGCGVYKGTFEGNTGPAMRANVGNDHKFIGNTVEDGASVGVSGSKSLVHFSGGTGHKCTMNELSKDANDHSVYGGNCTPPDLKIAGNVALGYGAGALGMDTGPTSGSSFESEYAAKNWTD